MGVFSSSLAALGSGGGNWFGDGADGDIRITAAGAKQSFNRGITWTAIPGWTKIGSEIMVPSVQDGDMVLINARSMTIDSGYTLTTSNRCRGLLVYCQGDLTVNGTISMTARGCHANPADSVVTSNTPVAPTDGHAVPSTGITIRRLAESYTHINTHENLFHGCGQAAVASEANQPKVDGDGLSISIPRKGGSGGAKRYCDYCNGLPGGTVPNGTGGGGSGMSDNHGHSGAGGNGTCFSGGTGGGLVAWGGKSAQPGDNYGGPGGYAMDYKNNPAIGGSGNPCGGSIRDYNGTGGLLLLIVGGDLGIAGVVSADGVTNKWSGASGGGVVLSLYAGILSLTGSISVAGGVTANVPNRFGGFGGYGSKLGPYKIDPA